MKWPWTKKEKTYLRKGLLKLKLPNGFKFIALIGENHQVNDEISNCDLINVNADKWKKRVGFLTEDYDSLNYNNLRKFLQLCPVSMIEWIDEVDSTTN
jgi:hypothetical protein